MEYRMLGRTGLETSTIGLGTWAFAGQAYGDVDQKEATGTVRAALDLGITLFDTAPLYGVGSGPDARDGVAEEALGKALGGERDKVIISTKFGRNPTDECRPAFHAERARSSIDDSLRRLATDRIDVLFFHSPFSPDEINDDVWAALDEAKDAGKVRAIGHSISMFQQTQQMARDWFAERKIDVVQVVYSLMNREARGLINDLGAQGCGVVARETLANGFLTGRIDKETVFPPNNLNSRYTRQEIAERVEYVQSLRFLVRDPVATLPQAALRWVLDNPHVSVALTGAKTRIELEDCAEAADAPPYSQAEMAKADSLHVKDYPAA